MKMIASINEVQQSITKLLKPSGFKRQATAWRRQTPEVTQVLSLQKSRWGRQYYVNSGVLLRAIDEIERPKPHQCHLVGRPEMILGKGEAAEYIIDLEGAKPGDTIRSALTAVEQIRDSFFHDCESVAGVRRYLRRGTRVLLTGEAKQFLRSSSTR